MFKDIWIIYFSLIWNTLFKYEFVAAFFWRLFVVLGAEKRDLALSIFKNIYKSFENPYSSRDYETDYYEKIKKKHLTLFEK